ncbi:prostate androgen-regulated mucin-like protein 1 isoform X2 [Arvicola amphibius]|uniref:prostate androgen-regulated mucin-like protein 1 isoform X2 n=1 Tax=Arvicola amphibius TaxID=1047088 RepID=UPI0018E2F2CF|nr:prostate androgen-regulated mucin-like protein 1 isoform X2 [Arvicola amphibius]
MVCKALIALCIFTAGLRVQGSPTPTPTPVSASLMTKMTPSPATLTTSAQNTAMTSTPVAGGTHNASVLPTAAASLTSQLSKNISTVPREEAVSSPASKWNGSNTESPASFSPTSNNVHLTPTPKEQGLNSPEASVPTTTPQPPTLISSQAPASTATSQATSPPESLSASSVSNHSSTVTSIQSTGAPTAPTSPAEGPSSSQTPTSHVTAEAAPKEKSPQDAEHDRVACESETTTPFLIMQEVENALSSEVCKPRVCNIHKG